jgi:hypothetical protein
MGDGNHHHDPGVIWVMRFPVAILIVLLLAASACGNASSSSGGGTTAGAPPGTITGTVVGFRSGHRQDTTPEAHVTVQAYTRAFPYIGPVTADRPRPVARAVSDARGHFRLDGLQPGHRYFLLFGMAAAKWVQLGSDHGATVTAAVCQDCPLPM